MFGRLMNSYYYGKSGKGDYRKDDLPKNRWQLFWEMLRIRLSGICRINLMTCVLWIPMMIVISMYMNAFVTASSIETRTDETTGASYTALVYAAQTDEQGNVTTPENSIDLLGFTQTIFLFMIPCILITGPAQAGLAYVTRNWARDEHAFPWGDFRDAVKANWKQALGISAITSVMPFVLLVCFNFYRQMQAQSLFFLVPQMLTLVLGLVWALGLVFFYPLMVTYDMKFGQLLKNGMMLAVARLPMAVGIRLCTLVPALIALAVMFFSGAWIYALMALAGYYIIIGNGLTRFIYASFTNAVFDRFINSHIDGVEVDRGLAKEDDDDDEPEDEGETPQNPQ